MDDIKRLERLTRIAEKPHVVLDTDAFNEQDDQYAISYAVKSAQAGEMYLDAIYAAPFTHGKNGDEPTAGEGMEQSYHEIIRLMKLMGRNDYGGFVFRGSDRFMEGHAVDSPAARDIIQKATAMPDDEPLYVVAIGAPTNVASAIVLEPAIIEKIVVVWLGGTSVDWEYANEYNLEQDLTASRVLLDCGVPLIQLPCAGVVSHFSVSVPEAAHYLEEKNELCDYLLGLLKGIAPDRVWTKVIWDVTAVGRIIHPQYFKTEIRNCPRLCEEAMYVEGLSSLDCYKQENYNPRYRWATDKTRHLYAMVNHVYRDALYGDLFRKLTQ